MTTDLTGLNRQGLMDALNSAQVARINNAVDAAYQMQRGGDVDRETEKSTDETSVHLKKVNDEVARRLETLSRIKELLREDGNRLAK